MNEERSDCPRCDDTRQRLYTKKVRGGWVRVCHNENCYANDGFIAEGETTPTETVSNVLQVLQQSEDTQMNIVREIRLPSDYGESIIPNEGYAWLYKYGIEDEEIKSFGIAYSERYKRLILPVFNDTKLVYWQGRNLFKATKDNPKYLNIRQSGAKNVFFKRCCERHSDIFSNTLVVVEDIISAIKVGRYFNSLALLGSYFPIDILNEFKDYDTIIIYLDSDKWKTSIKAAKHFNQITGKRFIVRYHEHDPKELSDEEIITFIGGT